jgi:hypothetical protein
MPPFIDQRKLLGFLLGIALELVLLLGDLMLEHLLLRQHGDEFAGAHREGSSEKSRDTGQDQHVGLDRRTRHAHDEACVGDEPVIDAEHSGPQRAAAEGFVTLADFLDRGRHGMRLQLRLAAIDRDPAHLGSRQNVAQGARPEDADEEGGDARPERRLEARDLAEILGQDAGLRFRSLCHLPEQCGVLGVGFRARHRARQIGSILFGPPALQSPFH